LFPLDHSDFVVEGFNLGCEGDDVCVVRAVDISVFACLLSVRMLLHAALAGRIAEREEGKERERD